jgi:hypothetical protein
MQAKGPGPIPANSTTFTPDSGPLPIVASVYPLRLRMRYTRLLIHHPFPAVAGAGASTLAYCGESRRRAYRARHASRACRSGRGARPRFLAPIRDAPDGEDIASFRPRAPISTTRRNLRQMRRALSIPRSCRCLRYRKRRHCRWGLSAPDVFTARWRSMRRRSCSTRRLKRACVWRSPRASARAARRRRRHGRCACRNPIEPRKLKALYIGAPSAMFLALERALAEQGGLVAAAFSSYAGFDHLHDEPFDAVVLNGAQDTRPLRFRCARRCVATPASIICRP